MPPHTNPGVMAPPATTKLRFSNNVNMLCESRLNTLAPFGKSVNARCNSLQYFVERPKKTTIMYQEHVKTTDALPRNPPAPWVPGCEDTRCFSNVPVCSMSGFCAQDSIESDGQVSRESEAQVSASRVLESKAKNHRVPFHQAGRRI